MFVGYTLNMFEILQAVYVAKTGRASFGGNDNKLPRLHCERGRISALKMADLKKKKPVNSCKTGIMNFIRVCQVK
jgi:hypothetical protein